jgi:hypothetical protein
MEPRRRTLVRKAQAMATDSPASPIVSNPVETSLFVGDASFFRENIHSSPYMFCM